MKLVACFGAALLMSMGALAQGHRSGNLSGFGNILYPGTGRPPVTPKIGGFGNVVFPGTGRAPAARLPFSITDPGFAHRLAGTVSGSRPYTGVRGHGGQGVVYMPYAYPVYVGGYDVAPQQPNVVVVYPQQQPPVVINQQFASPPTPPSVEEIPQDEPGVRGVRLYEAPTRDPSEMAEPATSGYLFAFKDHSIYSAIAYWVDGDTLHYFTSGNTHNQISISLLDRPLTERLNKERGVELRLPATR